MCFSSINLWLSSIICASAFSKKFLSTAKVAKNKWRNYATTWTCKRVIREGSMLRNFQCIYLVDKSCACFSIHQFSCLPHCSKKKKNIKNVICTRAERSWSCAFYSNLILSNPSVLVNSESSLAMPDPFGWLPPDRRREKAVFGRSSSNWHLFELQTLSIFLRRLKSEMQNPC